MNRQKVVIAEHLEESLSEAIMACEHDRVFILADEITDKCCLPVVEGFHALQDAKRIMGKEVPLATPY